MKTETQGTETADRDRVASLMTWTVGLGAAILSWAAWTGLAQKCGWTESLDLGFVTLRISWLAAIIVDVYALRAFRVWQRAAPWVSDSSREYAKWSTYISVLIGILGNVAYHVIVSEGIKTAPMWVVIPVSSLPPIMLGAIGHLNAIERRDRSTWRRTQSQVPVSVSGLARKTQVSRPAPAVSVPRVSDLVSTAKTQPPSVSGSVKVETAVSAVGVPAPREATVSSLAGQSATQAERLQMIKDAEPEWASKIPTKARVQEITGLKGSQTIQNLRAALAAEADALQAADTPTDDRELVSVG